MMYKLTNGILIRDSQEFARAGSIVKLKLHDTRIVQAKIVLIEETVAGIKIRARSKDLLLNGINPEQIVDVVSYR